MAEAANEEDQAVNASDSAVADSAVDSADNVGDDVVDSAEEVEAKKKSKTNSAKSSSKKARRSRKPSSTDGDDAGDSVEAEELDEELDDEVEEVKPRKKRKSKVKATKSDSESEADEAEEIPAKKAKAKKNAEVEDSADEADEDQADSEDVSDKKASAKKRSDKARDEGDEEDSPEPNADESDDDEVEEVKPRKKRKRKSVAAATTESEEVEEVPAKPAKSKVESSEKSESSSDDSEASSDDSDENSAEARRRRRASRKSMRIKKLKAKRRRKRSSSDSNTSMDDSAESGSKTKVAVVSGELDDEEFAGATGQKVTLDPPAKAKKQVKEAKEKATVVDDVEEVEEVEVVSRKKRRKTKPKVVEVDEIEEVEVVSRKSRKTKTKPVIEEIDEIEEVEVVKKPKKKPVIEVVDDDDIEEVPSPKARRKSQTGKVDRKTARKSRTGEDDAVVEVVKKPTKSVKPARKSRDGSGGGRTSQDGKPGTRKSKSIGGRDNKSAGRRKSRTGRDTQESESKSRGRKDTKKAGRRSRGRADDFGPEVATAKKGGVPPALLIGGIIGTLVLALVVVFVIGQDPEAFVKQVESSRTGKYSSLITQADLAGKQVDDQKLARLKKVRDRLATALKALKDSQLDNRDLNTVSLQAKATFGKVKQSYEAAKERKVSQIVAQASEYDIDGKSALALKELMRVPADLRDAPSWRDEAVPMLEQLQKAKGSNAIGRAILKRAESLNEEKNYDKALGVLAGFPDSLIDTEVGEEVSNLRRSIAAQRSKQYDREIQRREAEALARRRREQREAAERAIEKLIATESDKKWQKQIGRDLFTWQIRQDNDPSSQIWKLVGKTIHGKNLSGQQRVLAKNKADWVSFVLEFEAYLEKGTWHFHALSKLDSSNGTRVFGNQVKPTQRKGQWTKYKLYVIRGAVYEQIDGGERKIVEASGDTDARKTGGFGFILGQGSIAQFRNIRAKVLEGVE